jgi:hypothetical protein
VATRTLAAGPHEIRVEYYENRGDALVQVGWGPDPTQVPVATISAPGTSARWAVGDTVTFSGRATDRQQGTLPASALTWQLRLQHCPSTCHAHPLQTFTGVAGGSFTAPDHEYPSYLELVLTAADAQGHTASTTRRLYPRTTTLTFASAPAGRTLSVNGVTATAPFTRTVIAGSANSITAPSPQTTGGTTLTFTGWSDGGAATHNITAPAAAATFTATYTTSPGTPTAG